MTIVSSMTSIDKSTQTLPIAIANQYNQLSVAIGAAEKKSNFYRTRIAGIDTVMREIVGTIADIAESQLELISTFQKDATVRASSLVLQGLMDQRMQSIKDDAIESYDSLLKAREAIMEQGRKVVLTPDKREELKTIFKRKMDEQLKDYQEKNGGLNIDSRTDLNELKEKISQNLKSYVDIYERMLDSKVPLTVQVEKIDKEMDDLNKLRQALLNAPLDRWIACERGDLDYLNTEIQKCWKLPSFIASFMNSSTVEEFVNLPNHIGSPPLHLACSSRQLAVVQFLLQNKAKVDLKDSEGYTPLHRAVQVGDVQIATELLRHGAPMNALGLFNRTPLHMATYNGREEMTRFLLANGAAINTQTNTDGTCLTPLHEAVRMRRISVVALLTTNEALNVNIQDGNQHTALWYAITDGAVITATLLVGHNSWRPSQDLSNPNHLQNLLKIRIPVNETSIKELLTTQDQEFFLRPQLPMTFPQPEPASLMEFTYGKQRFKRCVTKGDGFCSVHALLGEPNANGIIAWKGTRKEIADQLKQALKQKNQELLPYFRAFFEGLSKSVGVRNSEYDPLLSASRKLAQPLRGLYQQLQVVQENQGENQDAQHEYHHLINTFIENHFDDYLQVFTQDNYYLTHIELEMVAHLFGKRILLLNQHMINHPTLEEQHISKDTQVIWHEGLHYEQCQPLLK